MFSTFRTQNISTVGNESFADQSSVTAGALEAVVVPVAVFEGDKTGAPDAGDGFGAGSATLCEEFAETFGAVGFFIFGGEPLTGQRFVAVGARETLAVPRFVLVGYTASRDDLVAFDAASGEFLLVAAGAVNVGVAGDERLGADWRFTDATAEAFLVPLAALVLHFLGSCAEDFIASVAPGGEHRVVAGTAVDFLGFGAKLLVDQRHAAFVAQEASLMPVTILVR